MSSALTIRSIVIGVYFIGITCNIRSDGNSIASSPTGGYKVVCSLEQWETLRYFPEHANGVSCTHVVFGYATLDESSLTMKPRQSWLDVGNPFYDLLRSYKQRGVKVILGFGGWTDSGTDKYSRMVSNTTSRRAFVAHALGFIEANGFDGLDILWQWPVCWRSNCTAGPASDKEGFSLLMEDLSTALKPKGLSFSVVVPPLAHQIDRGYNLTILVQHVDWISVKAYDYFGYWDGRTGHPGPLYDHPEMSHHFSNVNSTINHMISRRVPSRKIILGVSFYGRAFTTRNPERGFGLNVPANKEPKGNVVAYYKICEQIHIGNWTVVKDPLLRIGPYAYKGNKWVGFDDAEMVRHKAKYVQDMHLGGAIVGNLEYDDFLGTCGKSRHPLTCALLQVLADPVAFAGNDDCQEGREALKLSIS